MTFFSGIVDECDRVRLGGYPGEWRDLLGIRVTEFRPLPPGAVATASLAGKETFSCSAWQEDLDLAGAQVAAFFVDGPYAGTPALTQRAVGLGSAWYLATLPDPRGMTMVTRSFAAARSPVLARECCSMRQSGTTARVSKLPALAHRLA